MKRAENISQYEGYNCECNDTSTAIEKKNLQLRINENVT